MQDGCSDVDDSLFVVAPLRVCEFYTWPFFCNKELSVLSIFCKNLDEEARAGCFALVVFFLIDFLSAICVSSLECHWLVNCL